MMRRVQAITVGDYLQVDNYGASVGGGKRQITVGCDYSTGLIGWMRMRRG